MALERPTIDLNQFVKRPQAQSAGIDLNKFVKAPSQPKAFGMQIPKAVTDNPIYQGLDAIGQDAIQTSLGAFEGATAGIPRGLVKKATGYEIPRGNLKGQIAGTVAGPGKVASLATKAIKGFKGANLARLAAEGAITGASVPKENALDIQERLKSAGGGALFGAGAGVASNAIKASAPAAKDFAIRTATNIIRPTGKLAKRSKSIAEASLQQGVLRSSAEGTRQAAQTKIDDLLNEVDQIAQSVKNKTISADGASKRMDALAKWYERRGDPSAAAKVREVKNNILVGEGLKKPVFADVDQPLAQPENGFVIKKGSPSTQITPTVQKIPTYGKKSEKVREFLKDEDQIFGKTSVENAEDVVIAPKTNKSGYAKEAVMVAPKRDITTIQEDISSPRLFGPSNRVSEQVGEEFKDLSVERALKLRRDQDTLLKTKKVGGGYGSETTSPEIAARQEFTGALRRDIGRAVPEIAEKNKIVSALIDVASSAKNRAGVSSRNNLLDLVDAGLAGGGAVNAKLWTPLIAKKLYQAGKGPIARSAYAYSKNAKRFGELTDDPRLRKSLIAFGQTN